MQTICTSLKTDSHTNTSSLNYYRPDALPDAQPTLSKQVIIIMPNLTILKRKLTNFAASYLSFLAKF